MEESIPDILPGFFVSAESGTPNHPLGLGVSSKQYTATVVAHLPSDKARCMPFRYGGALLQEFSMINKSSGMTLMEVLVATLVFTIAMSGLLTSLNSVRYLFDISKNFEVAGQNLRDMQERIRSTTFSDMLTLFPNGDIDGPAGNPYATIVGGYTLMSEQITVAYANATAEPLETRVTVAWQDRQGRFQTVGASTFKAR